MPFILRDEKVLRLNISKQNGNKKYKTSILDSYCILTDSLNQLGKNFETETVKGNFPHNFATTQHLFYEGITPDKSYYNDISDSEYKSVCKSD